MNPARALLKKHVDRMIANGSPVIAEILLKEAKE